MDARERGEVGGGHLGRFMWRSMLVFFFWEGGRQQKCIATNTRCNLKRVPNTTVYRLLFLTVFFTFFCVLDCTSFCWRVHDETNGLCRIALRSQPNAHTFVMSTSATWLFDNHPPTCEALLCPCVIRRLTSIPSCPSRHQARPRSN